MEIPKIKSRMNYVSNDKGNGERLSHGSNDCIRETHGGHMDIQVPLLIIDMRVVSIMSRVFPNRRMSRLRVGTLRVDEASYEK